MKSLKVCMDQELIPGLPDDVAADCLARIDYDHLFNLSSVSRRWRQELRTPDFAQRRRIAGVVAQPLLVFALRGISTERRDHEVFLTFNPSSGRWRRLPPIPAARRGATYKLVVADHRIAALDLRRDKGQHTYSKATKIPNVHVFDLLTASWSRAAPSPAKDVVRIDAYASDGIRRVFLAGGQGKRRNESLRTAWSYDVDKDLWEQLPDMGSPRTSSRGFFQDNIFHVVGGLDKTIDRRYFKLHKSADLFHVSNHHWTTDANFIPIPHTNWGYNLVFSPTTGKLYFYQSVLRLKRLMVKEGEEWDLVWNHGDLDIKPCSCLMAWPQGLVLVEKLKKNNDHLLHFLSLEAGSNWLTWKTENLPSMFKCNYAVVSGCYLEV